MSFNDTVIAVSGTHKGYTQAKLEKLILNNGGSFAKVIDEDVTHLVTTQVDFDKGSVKVGSAKAINGLKIVNLDWLLESIENGKKSDEGRFLVGDGSTAAGSSDVALAAVKTFTAPMASKKIELEDVPKKRTRGNAAGPLSTVKVVDNEESEEEMRPAAKKAKAMPVGKGKRKAKVESEEEEGEEEEQKKEEAKKMKTVVKKGKAPVDELCPIAGRAHVYVDPNDLVYDATLNQANIHNNNNKFYYLQLLEGDVSKTYSVFAHWGRVGDRGQSKMYVQNTDLSSAISHFEKLFKSKTGKDWARRTEALGGLKKYTFLERNYEEDEDGQDEEMKDAEEVQSKLSKALQNLISLIFDTKIMQQSMSSMSYDAAKLPLGKLSKSTISQGYQVLKDLGQVIGEASGWQRDYAEYGQNKNDILTELSNRYYSIIPHVFPGRGRPTIINSGILLKQEVSLVENLADMVITTKLLKETKAEKSPDVNILDKQFDSLGLNEATALDRASNEFSFLEAYVKKTQGHTHRLKLHVEEIFRVHRGVEEERWCADGWDKLSNSDRRLLWHGSRTTNFPGILSQGLRIAPPEAPVNGYMFDKGIYLADIVSKSANYCCASTSDNTGLLLLCEAQLGDPMYECEDADYHAATKCRKDGRLATKGIGRTAPLKWEDAGVVHEDMRGVQMPMVTGQEENVTGNVKKSNSWRALEYNEYIVYNVSQVKIRYLFRVKFS